MKNIVYALAILLMTTEYLSAEDIHISESTPPTPPISTYARKSGGAGGTGPGHQDVPIDMHTSALLVAGIGLIASYTYFARRRKENI